MIPIITPEVQDQIEALARQRQKLLSDLGPFTEGIPWCAEHTIIVDRAILLLLESLRSNMVQMPRLAVIATGGYGRREMAPHSDVDLSIVPLEEDAPELDQCLRSLFHALHEAIGATFKLEIGYAYRLISDVPGLDSITRSGLIDARLVSGSQRVFSELMDAFWESMPAGEFILSKKIEREEALKKFNDTPLVVEPNLKEGAGGLRSFQTANWIGAAIGEKGNRPTPRYSKLLAVRNLLHKVSGRRMDQLSRIRQTEIDIVFGLDRDTLMQGVSESLQEGQAVYEEAMERLKEARYPLAHQVIALRGESRILSPAEPGQASIGIAIATRLGLNVSGLPSTFEQNIDGSAALFSCAQGEPTLRNLDRSGLLQVLLPELTDCRTLLPDDSSHTYTVFEHTMRVVRHLDGASRDPFLRDLIDSVADRRALYLAALLHDVGKSESHITNEDHAEAGARIARDVSARWKLDENTASNVEWLVREHLTMSLTLRLRDLQSSSTIESFAEKVGTVDRLNMLALLTWADISSVAEGTFTIAQYSFLKLLVARTYEVLEGDRGSVTDPSQSRRRLLKQLSKEKIAPEKIEQFVQSLPAYYLTSTSPEVVRLHMAYAQKASLGEPTVDLLNRSDLGLTDITLCALDTPGLLSQALGILYAYDLTINSIRASTTESSPHLALDTFSVSFSGRPVPSGTALKLTELFKEMLRGEITAEEIIVQRQKDPYRPQQVFEWTLTDSNPSILELRAPRGRGMPYRISRKLAEQGLNIVSARVGQWAGNAAAAFYVAALPGKEVRSAVKEALL